MEDRQSKRIIGRYDGPKHGPLLICTGGVHGNELAGIKALEFMLKMLDVEPITNPSFCYNGRFLALKGNVQAIGAGCRFINEDLNRKWKQDQIQRITQADIHTLQGEDLELRELQETINAEIEDYQPSSIVFLDLHTTTANGGIFTIPYEDESSITVAKQLYAPVILGLLDGIEGTMMHHFNQQQFPDIPTISFCFESGQHDDPLSINRAIAAITNCMRAIGSVKKEDVANRHDFLLQTYSEGLPPISHLLSKHSIQPGDGFQMIPGFKNFQKVKKGTVLAHDNNGEIKCPEDCLLLMPLYQKQGEDGFFLIKEGKESRNGL